MSLISKIKLLFGHKPKPSFEVATGIVERLIELDFLKFVPESDRTNVRGQLVESIQNNYLDSEWDEDCVSFDKRSYSADAENLAEGDVGKCIQQMSSILSKEGVSLATVADSFLDDDKRYEIRINGVPHFIYDLRESTADYIWSQSFRRLIEIVNSLLKDVDSSERLFGIYGGNDGRVIFLTPAMHDLLTERNDVFDKRWIPVAESRLP